MAMIRRCRICGTDLEPLVYAGGRRDRQAHTLVVDGEHVECCPKCVDKPAEEIRAVLAR